MALLLVGIARVFLGRHVIRPIWHGCKHQALHWRGALVPVISAGLFLIGFNLLLRLGFDLVSTLMLSQAPTAECSPRVMRLSSPI